MTFQSIDGFRPEPTDLLCRQSPWPAAVATGFIACVIAAGMFLDWPPTPLFRRIMMIMMGLIGLVFVRAAVKGFGPQNWLLRRHGGGIAIKFHSYLNPHFDTSDLVIVLLDRNDIKQFSEYCDTETFTSLHKGREIEHRRTRRCLDIELSAPADELAKRLAEERNRPATGSVVKRRSLDFPVSVIDISTIRVPWDSHSARVAPDLDQVLGALSKIAPVRPAQDQTEAAQSLL